MKEEEFSAIIQEAEEDENLFHDEEWEEDTVVPPGALKPGHFKIVSKDGTPQGTCVIYVDGQGNEIDVSSAVTSISFSMEADSLLPYIDLKVLSKEIILDKLPKDAINITEDDDNEQTKMNEILKLVEDQKNIHHHHSMAPNWGDSINAGPILVNNIANAPLGGEVHSISNSATTATNITLKE